MRTEPGEERVVSMSSKSHGLWVSPTVALADQGLNSKMIPGGG